jgi:hypothetical protein
MGRLLGDGGVEDFSATTRDLLMCDPVVGNLLANGDFEQPSGQAGDGSGEANNTGNPPSTIAPLGFGKWDGCCSQVGGGTTYRVTSTVHRCGQRAVLLASTQAQNNVLNQSLRLTTQAGRRFYVTGYVRVSQLSIGSKLALDLFDLTQSQVVAASEAVTQATADWQLVSLSGTVPSAGQVQLRIVSTGTLTAAVDDLALGVQ